MALEVKPYDFEMSPSSSGMFLIEFIGVFPTGVRATKGSIVMYVINELITITEFSDYYLLTKLSKI